MPPAQPRFEEIAGQRLPLGGVNGYLGVRGKQGRCKDKFQGVTPRKQHRTGLFDISDALQHVDDSRAHICAQSQSIHSWSSQRARIEPAGTASVPHTFGTPYIVAPSTIARILSRGSLASTHRGSSAAS